MSGRHFGILALLMAAGGCASSDPDYQSVFLHEVVDMKTKRGHTVGVQLRPFIAFREVIERSPNVKSVTRMTNLKDLREPGGFTVSPDGQWLVYRALEMKVSPLHANLWRTSTKGGTGSTRLTAGNYMDVDPNFDPKGEHIYFASNRSSVLPRIWRVKSTGAGGIVRVTESDSVDRSPSVEPSGEGLFYASKPANAVYFQIWEIGTRGNLPTQMREGADPCVSPDGKRVLYTLRNRQTKTSAIWVMNVDGTNPTQLTQAPDSNQINATWSADGKRIVYASNEGKDSGGKRNFDIWMMDADGSSKTQLTTNGSTDLHPLCDPAGKYVYFLSNRGFNWDIWRMEIIAP